MDTVREWIAANPLPPERYTQTLARVAERVVAGEGLRHASREWLDEVSVRPDPAGAFATEPRSVDARTDAFLAALAEHTARTRGLAVPMWTADPGRFLDVMWFPSPVKGFRAIALRDSPAAFRRRGIFIPARALDRV